MIIRDRIYGEIEIEEKVIQELVLSAPMQRLKKISQTGATGYIQPRRDVNRFEHCVGVWYLSQRYGRSIEEQIAALLHDVPHTAFSHVVDYVYQNKDHAYHDRFLKKVVSESEIPQILKKYGVEIEKVLDEDRFPLLHNNLPEISVDRWDYFMRDGYVFGIMPEILVRQFLAGIKIEEDKFYFDDGRLASMFSILFMNSSRLMWLDPTSCGSYFLLARALKTGLDKGIITQEDLFTTDEEVMMQLKGSKLPEIDEDLARLVEGKDFEYASKEEAEFVGLNKPRFVDPWVKGQDGLKRVSELVPGMSEYFEEFVERYKEVGVRQS